MTFPWPDNLIPDTTANLFAHNSWHYHKQAYVLGTDADGKVSVIIDKQEYKVKNGTGITFVEGNKCLVHYINGNSQKKVIIVKL